MRLLFLFASLLVAAIHCCANAEGERSWGVFELLFSIPTAMIILTINSRMVGNTETVQKRASGRSPTIRLLENVTSRWPKATDRSSVGIRITSA